MTRRAAGDAGAYALFGQRGFGLATANAGQVVTFTTGILAEFLPIGSALCDRFQPLRGMEQKIAGLRAKPAAKITISSIAILKEDNCPEKSSLLITWDDSSASFMICLYPSHDETEKRITRTLRLRRISDEIIRAGGVKPDAPPAQKRGRAQPVKLLDRLTPREREVVALLASGQTNKGAARILGLSAKTVEAHRARALKRLDVKTTADLIRVAIEGGLGPSDADGAAGG